MEPDDPAALAVVPDSGGADARPGPDLPGNAPCIEAEGLPLANHALTIPIVLCRASTLPAVGQSIPLPHGDSGTLKAEYNDAAIVQAAICYRQDSVAESGEPRSSAQ